MPWHACSFSQMVQDGHIGHASMMPLQTYCSRLQVVGQHSFWLSSDGSLLQCPSGINPIKQPRNFCKALRKHLIALSSPQPPDQQFSTSASNPKVEEHSAEDLGLAATKFAAQAAARTASTSAKLQLADSETGQTLQCKH